jgi:hypothetical protein
MAYLDQLSFMETWNMDDTDSRALIQRYIDEEWKLITFEEAKLMKALKKGPAIASLEPEWFQQRGYPRYIMAQLSGGDTVTFSGTLNGRTLTAELMKMVIGTGTILELRVSGVPKQVKITDDDFTDLAVTAEAYGNTTWANDNAPAQYMIVSQPGKDKDPFKEPRALPRELRKTYTQIFKRHVEITFQRQKMKMYGVQDETQHQVDMLMRDIKDEIQRALLYSRPYYDIGTSVYQSGLAVADPTMAGILWWCDYAQSLEANTDIYVDAGGAPLDKDMLDNLGRALVKTEQAKLDRGNYQIWMHGDTRGGTQDFDAKYRRITGQERTAGFAIDKVELKEGQVMPLIGDDLVAPDICLMMPMDDIEHGDFEGDTLRRDLVNMDPRFKQWMLHCGTWGTKPANERVIGLIYNLEVA